MLCHVHHGCPMRFKMGQDGWMREESVLDFGAKCLASCFRYLMLCFFATICHGISFVLVVCKFF